MVFDKNILIIRYVTYAKELFWQLNCILGIELAIHFFY
jgi:hypothetical protein